MLDYNNEVAARLERAADRMHNAGFFEEERRYRLAADQIRNGLSGDQTREIEHRLLIDPRPTRLHRLSALAGSGEYDGSGGGADAGTDAVGQILGSDSGQSGVTDSTPSPGADLASSQQEPLVTEDASGASQLVSTAAQTGLSDPYSPVDGGWIVGPVQVDPYTNESAAAGNQDPFVGQDVETYTGVAAALGGSNAFTGGPSADPFSSSQSDAYSEPTRFNTSQMLAANGPLIPEGTVAVNAASDAGDEEPTVSISRSLFTRVDLNQLTDDSGGPLLAGQAPSEHGTDDAGVPYNVYRVNWQGTTYDVVVSEGTPDKATLWPVTTPPTASAPPGGDSAVGSSTGTTLGGTPQPGISGALPSTTLTSSSSTSSGPISTDVTSGLVSTGPFTPNAPVENQSVDLASQTALSSQSQFALPPEWLGYGHSIGPLTPSTPFTSQSVNRFSQLPSVGDASTLSSSFDSTNSILGSTAINAGLAAVRNAFSPIGPSGDPLNGPLNLYTGPTARSLAQSAADGYLIRDTIYYGPADAAEQALRSGLGIPTGNLPQDQYNAIWGPASRDAVIDATLSGQGVTSYNDLSTLATNSIQAEVELPWLRGLGTATSVFQVGGGLLTLASATDPNLPEPLVPVAAVSGSLQVTGGLAYGIGAWTADGALMAAGAGVAETGGLLGIPLAVYGLYEGIEAATNYMINSMITGQIEQDAEAARRGSTTGELPPPYINNGPTGDLLNDFFLFP